MINLLNWIRNFILNIILLPCYISLAIIVLITIGLTKIKHGDESNNIIISNLFNSLK